jgi:hypothetical protein
MPRGALEHHVFEQMGHSSFAVVFIAGTNQVSHVYGNRLLGLIREEQDPQTVRQSVLGDAFD